MTPGGLPDVTGNADPFVKNAPQQVETAELFDDAVTDWFTVDLGGEGAEHPVPDNEGTGVVLVEIARIGRVMDAVVRRRVHHRLEPFGKTTDGFGVNPELVDQVDRADEQDHCRMEPDQRQRNPEDKAERDKARPALPQRGRQIVMLARMVIDVARPEPADAVAGPVRPVIGKIIEHKTDGPCPPNPADVEQAVIVKPNRKPEHKRAAEQTRHRAAGAERQRRKRIPGFVFFRRAALGPQHFGNDQYDECRNCIINRAEQFRHVAVKPASGAGPTPSVVRLNPD